MAWHHHSVAPVHVCREADLIAEHVAGCNRETGFPGKGRLARPTDATIAVHDARAASKGLQRLHVHIAADTLAILHRDQSAGCTCKLGPALLLGACFEKLRARLQRSRTSWLQRGCRPASTLQAVLACRALTGIEPGLPCECRSLERSCSSNRHRLQVPTRHRGPMACVEN